MKVELSTQREWLETNGLGGFASTTEGDCPTRKYHGLFVTPLTGYEGRFMLFSDGLLSIEEEGGFTLGSSYYPGVIHPEGYLSLESFTTDPVPTWVYDNGKFRIKKEVFMIQGDPSVYVAWTLLNKDWPREKPLSVSVKLLSSFRESHHLAEENNSLSKEITALDHGLQICPYHDLPSLSFQFSQEIVREGDMYWDRKIQYHWEKRRGFDFEEDRFVPGKVNGQLTMGVPLIMRVSLIPHEQKVSSTLMHSYEDEINRREKKQEKIITLWDRLNRGGQHFLVTNHSGQLSLVAGYPWFGEWGRDTMIALPGLLFGENLLKGAQVLSDYADHIKNGLIPNTLGEMQGFTSYNSVDASLLYMRAVDLLIKEGFGGNNDEKIILESKLFPAVGKIINAFLEGEVPQVMLTEEGLINSGSEKTQLTWMDAMVNGVPVTPRNGLAVDLNALWFEGLGLYKNLCGFFGKTFPVRGKKILSTFKSNFKEIFHLKDKGYLSDTVTSLGPDEKLRPNMLFATAVNLLDKETGRRVVEKAKRELLTPLGLRTLAPGDPQFISVYEGTGSERDSAYHQGTVWPWLLGIMVESSLNYSNQRDKEIKFWKDYLNKLLERHLDHEGIDSISEVFDGADPSEGKGCFAQAWSVGEILRAGRLLNG
jgi:predicted glycogen debranching enzyme